MENPFARKRYDAETMPDKGIGEVSSGDKRAGGSPAILGKTEVVTDKANSEAQYADTDAFEADVDTPDQGLKQGDIGYVDPEAQHWRVGPAVLGRGDLYVPPRQAPPSDPEQ